MHNIIIIEPKNIDDEIILEETALIHQVHPSSYKLNRIHPIISGDPF